MEEAREDNISGEKERVKGRGLCGYWWLLLMNRKLLLMCKGVCKNV